MANISRGLSNIAKQILEDAEREAEGILLKAESEGKTILKEAKVEAEHKYQSIMKNNEEDLQTNRAELENILDAEKRNELLKAREEMVEEVFDRSQNRLKQYASSPNYLDCLLKLISEASSHIGSDRLKVQFNKKDHQLMSGKRLQAVSKELKVDLVKSDELLDSIGGVVVSSLDGKVIVNNTFEDRLQLLKSNLRATLGRMLFEEESRSQRKEP